MATLDIFKQDAFSLVSLTAAVQRLPLKPARIGELGIFEDFPITTTTAVIEEQNGVLMIVPTTPRGAPATPHAGQGRKASAVQVPHYATEVQVLADEVQNVRAFGSENELEGVSAVVADKLTMLRRTHEVTREWASAGGIRGIVYDSDGTTELADWYSTFGIAPPADIDFLLGTSTTDVQTKCLEVLDAIAQGLGAEVVYDHIHALCSPKFFRAFTAHPSVKYAYQQWQGGEFLRSDPRAGFPFGGIVWEQYWGQIGGVPFVPLNYARIFPVGAPGLFQMVLSPADFIETVNTRGQAIYAKQWELEGGRGIKVHVQSNMLPVCTRPAALIPVTTST